MTTQEERDYFAPLHEDHIIFVSLGELEDILELAAALNAIAGHLKNLRGHLPSTYEPLWRDFEEHTFTPKAFVAACDLLEHLDDDFSLDQPDNFKKILNRSDAL